MLIFVCRTLYNIAARFHFDRIRQFCYLRWLRCYIVGASDPDLAYLNFVVDFLSSAYSNNKH